jgi:magnesium-transporting ATPase (P-type)
MLAGGLRVLGWSIMSVGFVLLARTGYLKRRPFWTADSWRRYLLVCSIPVSALLIMAAMMVALEMRLPMVGPPRSGLRSAWIAGTLMFMLVGGGGLAVAMLWLADGEPSRQFTWPQWLSGGA